MKRSVKRILSLCLVFCLLLPLLSTGVGADATVIYDAAAQTRFQRSEQEIASRYNDALRTGAGYVNGSSASYYTRPASLTAPYDQGVLAQDTLDAMVAMTNFLRWLEGAEPLTAGAANHDGLQCGALVRNFDFNHYLDDTKKPEDMDETLWNTGKNVSHNIIASGYTPRGAITGWCNEGYSLSSGSWNTVGHRYSLLEYDVSELGFGYAGRVAIGVMRKYGNSAQVPFTAFPAPGLMPTELLSARTSVWSLEPNRKLLSVPDAGALQVTVTNAATGEAYVCTSANGLLKYNTWTREIDFVQPQCSGSRYEAGSVYRVSVTGLKDLASGEAAELRYQVEFFSITPYELTTVSSVYPTDWSALRVPNEMDNDADLTRLAAVMPDSATVRTANGLTLTLPIVGGWSWDAEGRCWTAQPDASALPEHVTDPNGVLNSLKLSCTSTYYTGTLRLEGSAQLGQSGAILLYRYSDAPQVLLCQSSDAGVLRRFDESSGNYTADVGSGASSFAMDAWAKSDGGDWFAICYGASSTAWVTHRLSVEVVCPHDKTRTEQAAATCTEDGHKIVICERCGETVSQQTLPTLGHSFSSWEVLREVSCTESGEEARQCQRCGLTEHRTVEALGHDWDSGVVLQSPTVTREGEQRFTCTRCGQTRTELLPKLDPTVNPFVDVPAGKYYYNAVLWAFYHEPQITSGTDATHFSPNKTCTREQVVTFLYAAYGKPGHRQTENPFTDVKEKYYYDAVLWAVEHEITGGLTPTRFGVGKDCTRAQVVTFLWKAAGSPEPETTENPFADVQEKDYYYKPVLWAVENGITGGTGPNSFSPKKTCTRAQVVTFLYAALFRPEEG